MEIKEISFADIAEHPDYNHWEQAANEVKNKASKTDIANLASKAELATKADESALQNLIARVTVLEQVESGS